MRPASALDRVAGALLLVAAAPVLVPAAAWVRVRAGRPVLYRAPRVGYRGEPMVMYKLRTLRNQRAGERWGVMVEDGDARLIPGGAWLRARKIDELPQLWNVVRGDMALVGPRPEMPQHAPLYSDHDRRVLDVPPGLTDLASLRFFDIPAEVAAAPPDARPATHDDAYLELVHPERMRLRHEYVDRRGPKLDLQILAATAGRLLRAALPRRR